MSIDDGFPKSLSKPLPAGVASLIHSIEEIATEMQDMSPEQAERLRTAIRQISFTVMCAITEARLMSYYDGMNAAGTFVESIMSSVMGDCNGQPNDQPLQPSTSNPS